MEDNIQTIIIIIISAFLLFIFPVYMAYEKKDDISYALAMRYTQDLVDEVRSKGYLSRDMYEDYKARLKVTGNFYDIQLTHTYNRVDPVTNYYKLEGEEKDKKYVIAKVSTQEERKAYEDKLVSDAVQAGVLEENEPYENVKKYIDEKYKAIGYAKVEDTYKLSTEVYLTNYIEDVLKAEKKLQLNAENSVVSCKDKKDEDGNVTNDCQAAYLMNVDDNFNITIKNTNTTLATVIYNMVTAHKLDTNTRIYVNYGGNILSEKWYGKVDYTKMKHDDISLTRLEEQTIFNDERHFYTNDEGVKHPTENIGDIYTGNYALEFEVKPEETTELRNKGITEIASFDGYNFVAGNEKANNNDSTLSVSIGINGISLLTNKVATLTATTLDRAQLPTYTEQVEKEDGTIEEYTKQRVITDYSKLESSYESKGKIKIKLTGKSGVDNFETYINAIDDNNLLSGYKRTVNAVFLKPAKTLTGTINNSKYIVDIAEDSIGITATKYVANNMVVVSYPTDILEYTTVRIEVKDNIATLLLNGEKVAESVALPDDTVINMIGGTVIGSSTEYFHGYIKNVRMYKLM